MSRPRGIRARPLVAAGAAAVLSLLAGAASAADRVVLEGGAAAEGTIVSEDETEIVLRQADKEIRIPRRLVAKVERDAGGKDAAAPARSGGPAPAAAPAPKTGDGAAPAESKPAAAKPAAAPVPTEPDSELVALLVSEDFDVRKSGIERIVAGWPGTRATLEALLDHAKSDVRRIATQILERKELGDTEPWVTKKLKDESAPVRQTAVRAARARDYRKLEPRIVEMLQYDTDATVRAETLRMLEDRGSAACLDVVLAQYEHEKDKGMRRRLKRVLQRHTGEDHGDDLDAWREAVRRAPRPAEVDPGAAPPAKK